MPSVNNTNQITTIMKRSLLILLVSILSFSSVYAQDMESATNTYNSGAVALNDGKKEEALKLFQDALAQAEVIGAEAEELAANCKKTIPVLILSIGKEMAANKDIDNAIVTLKDARDKAEKYAQDEVVTEINALIPQLYMAEGNTCLNSGDFTNAIINYNKVIEINPTDGIAFLRIGQASSRTNNDAETIAAFENAIKNGQEAKANQELSKFYYKKAATAFKNKNNAEAYEYGMKANIPQALSICGKAAIAQKKYKEAVEAFEEYLAKVPNAKDASSTMYQLATAYEALGDKDKACGYYKQIVNDPQFKEFATHKVNNELKCN